MTHRVNRETTGQGPLYRSVPLAIAACLLGTLTSGADAAIPATHEVSAASATTSAAHADLSLLPLNFEANLGQATSPDVQYVAHGKSYGIALTKQGAVLALGADPSAAKDLEGSGNHTHQSNTPSDVIRLQLLGAHSVSAPSAEQALPGKVNYFIGNDPSKWRTNVPTYGKVRYPAVYPGVDLVYYGNQGHLEYDFAVAPGASPAAIGVRFEGAQKLHLDTRGNLSIETHGRQIAFERPVAYQMDGERRVSVPAAYRLAGTAVRFKLGAYDHSKALIIDPILSYFSYLGGSGPDYVGGTNGYYFTQSGGMNPVAVDTSGNLYVVGQTQSTNFPTANAYAPPVAKTGGGDGWAFVTSISPNAASLNYSTYIGGSINDAAQSVAIDSSGNVYLVGTTDSPDFPTTPGGGAYQRVCNPDFVNSPGAPYSGCGYGSNSAFVTKLNSSGALVASTFLGGSPGSQADAVALDSANRVYVVGIATPGLNTPAAPYQNQTSAFPTTPGALLSAPAFPNGANDNITLQPIDAFVSVFDPTLSTLLYSTLFGDTQVYNPNAYSYVGNTYGYAVAVDAAGNFYIGGTTNDAFLPTTSNAVQPAVSSCGVPYGNGDANMNGNCGFVAKFSPLGTAAAPAVPKQIYGTYLGGGTAGQCCGTDGSVSGLAADSKGDLYVTGWVNQQGFPTTAGSYQPSCGQVGDSDCAAAFIAELNPGGTALLASTYYGNALANGSDQLYGTGALVLDASSNVYIAGWAYPALAQVNSISKAPSNIGPYVAKFDSGLKTLLFATLIDTGGANAQQSGWGLAVDSAGNIYTAGSVNNNSVPTTSAATAGVFQPAIGGNWDGFVAKISGLYVPTSTTLKVSTSSAVAGTPVTFTATVAQSGGTAVPTGTVTFKSGTATLGSGTLGGAGVATIATSSLAVGSYSVTAVYSGDSGNSGSSSSAVALTITQAVIATTTKLAASTGSAAAGSSVTFTATVTPASGTVTPTGPVTFTSGATVLGIVSVNGSGQAILASSSLPVGADSVTAAYGGSTSNKASTSNAVSVTITPAAAVTTTTAVTASPPTTTIKKPVILTATVTPSGGSVPTGKVTFSNGGTVIATVAVNGAGQASFTTGFAFGTQAISAVYSGSAGDGASSGTLNLPITALRGDINHDGQVDSLDLALITSVLNTPASGPNDPRDLNNDGVINGLDARIEVTLCTNAGCAIN
jgi:hypothetical protein